MGDWIVALLLREHVRDLWGQGLDHQAIRDRLVGSAYIKANGEPWTADDVRAVLARGGEG